MALELVVEKLISRNPKTKGKFILLEFLGTGCEPCKKAILKLNEWQKRYKKNLVIVALSGQTAEKVKRMTPKIEHYNAIDTKRGCRKI